MRLGSKLLSRHGEEWRLLPDRARQRLLASFAGRFRRDYVSRLREVIKHDATGVGPTSGRAFAALQIHALAELRQMSTETLRQIGANKEHLYAQVDRLVCEQVDLLTAEQRAHHRETLRRISALDERVPHILGAINNLQDSLARLIGERTSDFDAFVRAYWENSLYHKGIGTSKEYVGQDAFHREAERFLNGGADIAILYGVPGTGKTRGLIEIAKVALAQGLDTRFITPPSANVTAKDLLSPWTGVGMGCTLVLLWDDARPTDGLFEPLAAIAHRDALAHQTQLPRVKLVVSTWPNHVRQMVESQHTLTRRCHRIDMVRYVERDDWLNWLKSRAPHLDDSAFKRLWATSDWNPAEMQSRISEMIESPNQHASDSDSGARDEDEISEDVAAPEITHVDSRMAKLLGTVRKKHVDTFSFQELDWSIYFHLLCARERVPAPTTAELTAVGVANVIDGGLDRFVDERIAEVERRGTAAVYSCPTGPMRRFSCRAALSGFLGGDDALRRFALDHSADPGAPGWVQLVRVFEPESLPDAVDLVTIAYFDTHQTDERQQILGYLAGQSTPPADTAEELTTRIHFTTEAILALLEQDRLQVVGFAKHAPHWQTRAEALQCNDAVRPGIRRLLDAAFDHMRIPGAGPAGDDTEAPIRLLAIAADCIDADAHLADVKDIERWLTYAPEPSVGPGRTEEQYLDERFGGARLWACVMDRATSEGDTTGLDLEAGQAALLDAVVYCDDDDWAFRFAKAVEALTDHPALLGAAHAMETWLALLGRGTADPGAVERANLALEIHSRALEASELAETFDGLIATYYAPAAESDLPDISAGGAIELIRSISRHGLPTSALVQAVDLLLALPAAHDEDQRMLNEAKDTLTTSAVEGRTTTVAHMVAWICMHSQIPSTAELALYEDDLRAYMEDWSSATHMALSNLSQGAQGPQWDRGEFGGRIVDAWVASYLDA